MARTTADACMFCGEMHTGQCGGKPSRPKIERVRKASPPSTREALASAAPAPRVEASGKVGPSEEAATSEPVSVSRARPNLSNVNRVRDPYEAELGRALTLFAERDMMSAEDLKLHRGIISLPDHKIDAMIWKQVNNEVVRNNSGR